MTKFVAVSANSINWFKPKELASSESEFTITGASRHLKKGFKDDKEVEQLLFEVSLESGESGQFELYPTQARLKIYEQVVELVEDDDVLEGVYLVLDSYEKVAAKFSKTGKMIKPPVLEEYIRFSDVPQSIFDEKKAEKASEEASENM